MKILTCPNCGGQVKIDDNFVSAHCPYCKSIIAISPEDLGINKNISELLAEMFKGEAVGSFLKQRIKELNRDEFWKHNAKQMSFEAREGTIEISYIHKTVSDSTVIFTARSNVILLFDTKELADKYCYSVEKLMFPENDTRNLKKYVPQISNRFTLINGNELVIIEKGENEYPLEAFGKLSDVHTAWIVSRLENLCCLLQYNNSAIPNFNVSDFYIDPDNHQVFLYGGFWKYETINSSFFHKSNLRKELVSLRQTALKIMENNRKIPETFLKFLNSEPQKDAFDDFKQWDIIIYLAYGKRTFRKLEYDNSIFTK